MNEHPDVFWGLVASFWVGNALLVIINMPLIVVWVKLLSIPYRYLYPTALFFICIGVWSTNSSLFDVGETLFVGIAGYILTCLISKSRQCCLALCLDHWLKSTSDGQCSIKRKSRDFYRLRSSSNQCRAHCLVRTAGSSKNLWKYAVTTLQIHESYCILRRFAI